MRQYLAIAAAHSLTATAALAQMIPMAPMQPMTPMPAFGASAQGDGQFKPHTPPKAVNVYDDGPLSPAAEKRRVGKAAEPPAGGMFSPEAEAKRERERAKHFHPF